MRTRMATLEDREKITSLTFLSKAHWGYDAAFMESVREELKVPVKHIEAGYGHVLEDDAGNMSGFFSLIETNHGWELDFFFLHPMYIGKGLGRSLWEAVIEQARHVGIESFAIVADPHAEGFYRRMGAERIGEVRSSSVKNRMLPLLRAEVPQE